MDLLRLKIYKNVIEHLAMYEPKSNKKWRFWCLRSRATSVWTLISLKVFFYGSVETIFPIDGCPIVLRCMNRKSMISSRVEQRTMSMSYNTLWHNILNSLYTQPIIIYILTQLITEKCWIPTVLKRSNLIFSETWFWIIISISKCYKIAFHFVLLIPLSKANKNVCYLHSFKVACVTCSTI